MKKHPLLFENITKGVTYMKLCKRFASFLLCLVIMITGLVGYIPGSATDALTNGNLSMANSQIESETLADSTIVDSHIAVGGTAQVGSEKILLPDIVKEDINASQFIGRSPAKETNLNTFVFKNQDGTQTMKDPENVDAQYRTEFSIKALTDAGMEVNKLFEQRGDWDQTKGQELAATALTQFGNDVDVIFCNNDAMALGAYQAILQAGRTVGQDIMLLGVDALAECVEMVKEGTMTGTVLNDHNGQSHTAADAALKAAKGETLEKYYWVDYVMVK